MGVTVAVTRFAADTGGGNQSITTTDLRGLTPKAVLFFYSWAVTDGTPIAGAVWGMGAATGTSNRWSFCGQAEDAVGTSQTTRQGTTDECIQIILEGSDPATIEAEADIVGFITNGVQINWGNTPASAYLITAVFFAGTDLSAQAAIFRMPTNENDTIDVNSVGFEPDVLITGNPGKAMDDAPFGGWWLSFGCVINDGSDTQRCWNSWGNSGFATAQVGGIISNAYGTAQVSNAADWLWAGEFGTFDSSGFSCTTRQGTATTRDVGFLALSFGGLYDFWLGTVSTPTGTGDQSITAPGFEPQAVIAGVTQLPAVNTFYTNGDPGSFGASAFDEDDEYCASWQNEDAQGTTDTQSLSDNSAVNLPNDDASAGHIATFVDFIPTGWIWDFTTTEGTAVQYWALAIETHRRVFITHA